MRWAKMFEVLFMVIYHPVFCSLGRTEALRIEPPLPPTVTPAQPVTFRWVRESGDPTQFGFQKLPSGGPPLNTFTVEEARKQSGEFTLTFTRQRSYSVVAIDLDSNPRRTFFTAPEPVFATSLASTSSGPDLSITPTSSSPPNWPGSTEGSQSGTTYAGSVSPPPTSTTTPQKSKNPILVIVGSTVGGFLGFSLLLLLIVCLRHRRSQVRFPLRNNITELKRYQQDLILKTLTTSDVHIPSKSFMAEQQLGNTGRNYTMEASAQSVAPRLPEQLKVLVPELATLQSQDSADENEHRVVERAVEGLRSQLAAVTQRVAQLESELADSAPPDYAPNPSDLPIELGRPVNSE
ncbi:hypothetical protein PQX77_015346 [Marasmius sp. AFHP31]|nr:hypothetical protein PQX77_015346 [Marasmius sp. AFHP31]